MVMAFNVKARLPLAPLMSIVPELMFTIEELLIAFWQIKVPPEIVKVGPADQVDAPVIVMELLVGIVKFPVVNVSDATVRTKLEEVDPKVTVCPAVPFPITFNPANAGHSFAVLVKAPVLVYFKVGDPE